jgi:hypothetical protein
LKRSGVWVNGDWADTTDFTSCFALGNRQN